MFDSIFLKPFCDFARKHPKIIGFPESYDPRVLKAVEILLTQKVVARVVLWGDPKEISALAKEQGIKLETLKEKIIFKDFGPELENELEHFRTLRLKERGKDFTQAEIKAFCSSPLNQAGWLLETGEIDAVVAGSIATTAEVIRAGLATVGLSKGNKTVSGAFLMHRPASLNAPSLSFLFGDSAVVVEPSIDQLVDIAASLVTAHLRLRPEVPPKVAFISFSTKGSAKHPRADRVRTAFEQFHTLYPNILADGELQIDAALVPEVFERKAKDSPLRGQANILVFPDLDSGNTAYKITQRLAGFTAFGPLLLGLAKPYSDLSRGASAEDIAITSLLNISRGTANDLIECPSL